ncbi:MAG TPA: cellobiose phosphorylase [Candidatus Omnitrophota bacterium]|nr:cellobiose phosphorylase [Candidatus Omnitrophota bacterium]
MPPEHIAIDFLEDGITFKSKKAAHVKRIYAPLCAPEATGLKSSITPFLSGDIKLDKFHYLTKPVSREDLRNPVRNFFIRTEEGDIFSLTDREGDDLSEVRVGQLWHILVNRSERLGVELEALSFIPVNGDNVEIMQVTVRNRSEVPLTVTATGCIPVFGRSLVNKHDHEHVTSLLHRVEQCPEGMIISPTMAFNEEGHKEIRTKYFVLGSCADGTLPEGSFPTVEEFLGEGGTLDWPQAVVEGTVPRQHLAGQMDGQEVAGAIAFGQATIPAGDERVYILMVGISEEDGRINEIFRTYNTQEKVAGALADNKRFWEEKSGAIRFMTGDEKFDSWMRWVSLQPVLRRIFGCSFLPDHDYGKGGKGWRDLWQDLLSLILIEPDAVRSTLINNFAGVRIDGSNATIIGNAPGEFLADRNAITRVWMDHGAWPWLTMRLYIDQTGDEEIIWQMQPYFRDMQLSRTRRKDKDWASVKGAKLLDQKGFVYQGSLLEHVLVQTLTQFFNVGEHNMIRLESADWNDGLDMAFERGESVAFSAFYAGNLISIADFLEHLYSKGLKHIRLFKECLILLDTLADEKCDYDNVHDKRSLLFEKYCQAVEPVVSGEAVDVDVRKVIADLRRKGQWLAEQIRKQEKISVEDGGKTYHWFNGYYDNQGRKVEGKHQGNVRMTLTGQVFALMQDVANRDDVQEIIQSVEHFLKDPFHGGHRLNTDFKARNELDFGRAFSFAYGRKENGAVFSHMAVMYAYALYHRGCVQEGYEALQSLYRMSMCSDVSRIYPNIPEYFDSQGRGMYPYLTGSASWYVLTLLTQSFGIRGENGDLKLEPKLVAEQFSGECLAQAACWFAGRKVELIYQNRGKNDFGSYVIKGVLVNGEVAPEVHMSSSFVTVPRAVLERAAQGRPVKIQVLLERGSAIGAFVKRVVDFFKT